VRGAGPVKPKKVGIVGHQDSPFSRRESQLPLICRGSHIDISGTCYVDASTTKARGHTERDMLVKMEANDQTSGGFQCSAKPRLQHRGVVPSKSFSFFPFQPGLRLNLFAVIVVVSQRGMYVSKGDRGDLGNDIVRR
jgi:hypothetical protein